MWWQAVVGIGSPVLAAVSGLVGAKIGSSSSLKAADHTAKAEREAERARWLRERREAIYMQILTDALELQRNRRKAAAALGRGETATAGRLLPAERKDQLGEEANIRLYAQDEVLDRLLVLKTAEQRAAMELARWNRVAPMPPALSPVILHEPKKKTITRARGAIAEADGALTALEQEIKRALAADDAIAERAEAGA